MNIFPAIDIIGGKVVRLAEGDYNRAKQYEIGPEEAAAEFAAAGAKYLHAVDLDGAKNGRTENAALIGKIAKESGLFVETGGGIRTEETAERYLSAGVQRVILGTAAVENFALVRALAKKYPESVAVGVDARNGKVAVRGWLETTKTDAFSFCEKLRDAGVKYVVYTDISKDGMLSGANLEIYGKLAGIEGLNVTASGGITYAEEIRALKRMGVYGAIVGKAMYEGKLPLKEALSAAEE